MDAYGGHNMQPGDRYIVDVGLRRKVWPRDDGTRYVELDGPIGAKWGYLNKKGEVITSKPHPVYTWTESGPERGH